MKQLFMDIKTGSPLLMDVPAPRCKKGGILVETLYSLVSAGTEKSLLSFGKKGLLAKAKERPDQVKKVLDKIKSDGALTAVKAAFNKLDEPLPLGYSSVGRIIETGLNAQGFKVGDLVACAGLTAGHSEVNYVPLNLAIKLPQGFKNVEQASFVALGSIAMQGVRQASVSFGDWVAVIGLGLVGQLVCRILHAAGCRVIGIDLNPGTEKDALGYLSTFVKSDDPSAAEKIRQITGLGCDAIVITAATDSNQPIDMAAQIARDRATISMVGVTNMDIPRRPFYEKELTFKLSRSYGPGRYDNNYEDKGIDYPIGYVKWTEKRNMEEFIRLIHEGKINLDNLVTHTFEIEKAQDAYTLITENPNKEKYIGVLLQYPSREEKTSNTITLKKDFKKVDGKIGVGFIGGGNFTRSVILPNMSKIKDFEFVGLATSGSASAGQVTKKYNFKYSTTDHTKILQDPEINLVVIATPHSTHAPFVIQALDAGKHVYVEKPLAINMEQLEEVKAAYEINNLHLFVGFNRRYSPFAKWLKKNMQTEKYPCMIQYTVNAGPVPLDHWTQDPEVGGGRIIGECCHFIDLAVYMTDSKPVDIKTTRLGGTRDAFSDTDNVLLTLSFENGSVAEILYTSLGNKSYPKEQVKVFCNGNVGEIDNYAKAQIHTEKGKKTMKKIEQDKGFREEYLKISKAILNAKELDQDSIFDVSSTAIRANDMQNNCSKKPFLDKGAKTVG